ncbi:hypothetical protein DFAR_2310024 [Desulfarculales bacterium]
MATAWLPTVEYLNSKRHCDFLAPNLPMAEGKSIQAIDTSTNLRRHSASAFLRRLLDTGRDR